MTEAPLGPAHRPAPVSRSRWLTAKRLYALVPILFGGGALWLLHRQLESYSWAEVLSDLRATPNEALALAVALTAVSYLSLTGYDWLALRYLGSSIPYRRSAPISLASYGISNALGFPIFTSTPLRFRLYGALGLGAGDIVRLIAFVMTTFWLGLVSLGGLLLLLEGADLARLSGISLLSLRVGGLVLLGVLATYFFTIGLRTRAFQIRSWRLELPTLRLALGQALFSAIDWALTACVLWALLPQDQRLEPALFLGAYLLAQLLGVLSNVPGGLGVFEATMVLFLTPSVDPTATAGALLLFRAIYYLLPLASATAILVVLERRTLRDVVNEAGELIHPWLGPIVPRALGIATFVAGSVLLLSGSLPSMSDRMRALDRFLPLGLLESSHLLASVIGVALLGLARGLNRRLDAAWHLAVGLLCAGIVFALLRGLDWEEASALGVVLLLLVASRRHFYRKASLSWRPLSPRWILAVGVVLLGAYWLGRFAIQNTDYSSELLWRFSLRGDAPRFLRAQVAVISIIVLAGVWRLLRAAPPPTYSLTEDDDERIQEIVRASPRTTATLALLGDKRFLFAPDRQAFIMYGISGDSWISMGDPVGAEDDWPELVWRFREECDLYDERPVFYQIRPDRLPVYLDAGLTVLKLGESARVSLQTFNLDGSARKAFRSRMRKAETEGLELEIVPVERVPPLLPELRLISDDWLREKNTREKRFSLGQFDEDYLSHFPIAAIRLGGHLVAFANVLPGAGKEELSLDLMRYSQQAPHGVMDYLFVRIMLWGRDEGYRNFHLGMAPLAGLDRHPLAPVWNRLGAWLFRHGEHFYNFQGLRDYKEKFDPEWEPRYLAAPDGLATSRALLDVATLISGGAKGLLTR